MTLDNSARTAVDEGFAGRARLADGRRHRDVQPDRRSSTRTENAAAAESFVEFVLSDPGQVAIAGTGWQPIRPSAGGPPAEGPQVYPDWDGAFGRQEELLAGYRAIFGG